MKERTNKFLIVLIMIIQLFDIIIHAMTNQLEILRVTSNIVILLWLTLVLLRKIPSKFLQVAIGSISTYTLLNLVFLVLEGVRTQNGEPRIMLFLLILSTLASSTWFALKRIKH